MNAANPNKQGFSLIEILVVIAVFAVVGVVSTQAILTTLKGARRTDSDAKIRQNMDYAVAIMERQLRSAKEATCTSPTRIDFTDSNNTLQWFELLGSGANRYIGFSDSANRLSSDEITVTNLVFTCTTGVSDAPDRVTVMVTAEDKFATGSEKASITTGTQVTIRSAN